MNKIVIITGLTASGKSGLALALAKKYNGEIISADSVQIYRGLDIGSAKESIVNRNQIKHHLIDIKSFDETYNVGEFITDCKKAIDEIIVKKKLPIIVGGTGLYVKALIEGYSLGGTIKNSKFRDKYTNLALEKGNEYVWNILNEKNSERAKSVHYNNLKRVIRYLEIEQFGNDTDLKESVLDEFDVISVGIIEDREKIYSRIDTRVDEMISSGLEEEVKTLISNGANRDNQSMNSIGYKEWFDYFDGLKSYEETISLIKQHSRNYCKRQLTFLKIIKNLQLLTLKEAEVTIENFLKS